MQFKMLQRIKHIVRICIAGLLLVGVSGVTFVIHHEHPIGTYAEKHTAHSHDETATENQQSKPSTYHEVHFVKLGSDDNFTSSSSTDCRIPLVSLIINHANSIDSPSTLHSAAFINIAAKETGPPSVDRCVLFCAFLV
jgi:hypothetical protein